MGDALGLPVINIGSRANLASVLGVINDPTVLIVAMARRFRPAIVEAAARCARRHGSQTWSRADSHGVKHVARTVVGSRDSDRVVAAIFCLNMQRDFPMFCDELVRSAMGLPQGGG